MADNSQAPAPSMEWQRSFLSPYETAAATKDASRNAATYTRIKQMILAGQLRPGNKLVNQDLAAALNVSRTPVREALERLYQEGFVTRLPRRGFYVADITFEEARDLYGAREALEIHALQETLGHGAVSTEAHVKLGLLLDQYDGLLQQSVLKERVLVDVSFHMELAALSGNRYVVRLLGQTFERIILKRRMEGYRSDRGAKASREHRLLLRALAAKRLEQAQEALRLHIREARDSLLVYLRDIA